jgi:hypothetical protein
MRRCLDVVASYRVSCQKAKALAQAPGVPEHKLASWCASARRWQARLDGVTHTLKSQSRSFVASRWALGAAPSMGRMQMTCGAAPRGAALSALAIGPDC